METDCCRLLFILHCALSAVLQLSTLILFIFTFLHTLGLVYKIMYIYINILINL